jgi:hypothetical protein
MATVEHTDGAGTSCRANSLDLLKTRISDPRCKAEQIPVLAQNGSTMMVG